MTNIPKTFCPAKWDELFVNLSANYVYSCCRAKPIQILKKDDIEHALTKQKQNLLDGIQDPACEYCWGVEREGKKSYRHSFLKDFDAKNFKQYKDNTAKLKLIEVNLGNECNFQCTYCNPKFSSQWESDVRQKPYKIYSDRHFYAVEEKNKDNIKDTISWLKTHKFIETLEIIGGEPLQSKHFFTVINSIKSDKLIFATNLSCKTTKPLDKILLLSKNYKNMRIAISIDSTDKNAEFSRYGLNFNLLLKNINYLIANLPKNVDIIFNSLMSSITIRDFANISILVDQFCNKNSKIVWNLTFPHSPNILTLNTLPDKFKPEIIRHIQQLRDKKYIKGLDALEGAILNSKFNNTMFNQMKHFLEEFSNRKHIEIPVDLTDV